MAWPEQKGKSSEIRKCLGTEISHLRGARITDSKFNSSCANGQKTAISVQVSRSIFRNFCHPGIERDYKRSWDIPAYHPGVPSSEYSQALFPHSMLWSGRILWACNGHMGDVPSLSLFQLKVIDPLNSKPLNPLCSHSVFSCVNGRIVHEDLVEIRSRSE